MDSKEHERVRKALFPDVSPEQFEEMLAKRRAELQSMSLDEQNHVRSKVDMMEQALESIRDGSQSSKPKE